MIGLDTNVLVRYIMQDDAKQAAKATKLIEGLTAQEPGFITQVALVELVWVLGSFFDLDRTQIVEALDVILRSKQLVVDQAEHVVRAQRAYGCGNADFADCLIERTAGPGLVLRPGPDSDCRGPGRDSALETTGR